MRAREGGKFLRLPLRLIERYHHERVGEAVPVGRHQPARPLDRERQFNRLLRVSGVSRLPCGRPHSAISYRGTRDGGFDLALCVEGELQPCLVPWSDVVERQQRVAQTD